MESLSRFFYMHDHSNPEAPPSLHIRNVLLFCVGGVVLTVIAYAAFLVFKTWPIDQYSIASAGTFGDSFGMLNSLFTGLGFAGLLVTIFLQREDLKLTRIELSETREEIKNQSLTFRQQQFEESFYRILALYKDNLYQISVRVERNSDVRMEGVNALISKQRRFEDKCKIELPGDFPMDGTLEEKDDYAYNLYQLCDASLPRQSRYMETLNTILDVVTHHCFDEERKEYYFSILSSQLTAHEAKYIFYQAFLDPNYNSLRSTLANSHAFSKRFQIDSIDSGHYAAFEYLWNVRLASTSSEHDRLFASGRFREARLRARGRAKTST